MAEREFGVLLYDVWRRSKGGFLKERTTRIGEGRRI